MESGKEGEEGGFGAFSGGGFIEMLGSGEFDCVDGLLDIEEGKEEEEEEDRRVEREDQMEEAFLVRCPSSYPPCSSTSSASYRMLCFGGEEALRNNNNNGFPQKSSGASGNDSCSSTSSSSSNSILSKSKKTTEGRRGRSADSTRGKTASTNGTTATTTSTKRPRKEQQQQRQQQQRPPISHGGTLKMSKEKLGERIASLQQLVSPFGKSDTASVLHEAVGYIRFLHDQVTVLSSPYLQRLPSSSSRFHEVERGAGGGGEAELGYDLRSRGLCLVPVSCTGHVADSINGADFWLPVMGSSNSSDSPSVSKH